MTTKNTAEVLRLAREMLDKSINDLTGISPEKGSEHCIRGFNGVCVALALLDSVQAGEEVTEDRFSETVGSEILADEWPSLTQMQQHDLIFLQLGEFFPNGLKIVRGEKS